MNRLAIAGGVGLDTLVYPDGHTESRVGGSAWYAVHAASLFTPTSLVAAVGEDFPDGELAVLRGRGVDFSGFRCLSGRRSFRWTAAYAENPDDRVTLSLDPNVEEEFEPVVPACPFLFLANCRPPLQQAALRGNTADFIALDTIDRWIQTSRPAIEEMLPSVALFFVNRDEAALWTGQSDPSEAARAIIAAGVSACVVKLGAAGAIVRTGSSESFIDPAPVEKFRDATGAGDVFAGAMLGCLAARGTTSPDDESLRSAAAVGARVAAWKIGGPGVERLQGEGAALREMFASV